MCLRTLFIAGTLLSTLSQCPQTRATRCSAGQHEAEVKTCISCCVISFSFYFITRVLYYMVVHAHDF